MTIDMLLAVLFGIGIAAGIAQLFIIAEIAIDRIRRPYDNQS